MLAPHCPPLRSKHSNGSPTDLGEVFEKTMNGNSEGLSYPSNVFKRDVSLPSLNGSNIGSVKSTLVGKLLLRPTFLCS